MFPPATEILAKRNEFTCVKSLHVVAKVFWSRTAIEVYSIHKWHL